MSVEEEYKTEDCIGCRVAATMNMVHWLTGTLVGLNDHFVPYKVRLDDSGEIRSFRHVALEEAPEGVEPIKQKEGE